MPTKGDEFPFPLDEAAMGEAATLAAMLDRGSTLVPKDILPPLERMVQLRRYAEATSAIECAGYTKQELVMAYSAVAARAFLMIGVKDADAFLNVLEWELRRDNP